MPKYYVQCGPVRVVLTADSKAGAAFHAVECSLRSHAWIYDDPSLSDRQRRDHLMLESLLHLDPSIRISERGFGPDRHAVSIGTPEIVDVWHDFMTAVRGLFVKVGLAPQLAGAVGGRGGVPASARPRRPR